MRQFLLSVTSQPTYVQIFRSEGLSMVYDKAETVAQDARNGLRRSLQMTRKDCSKEVLEAMRKAWWSEEAISLYEKRSSWRLPLGGVLEPSSTIEEETKPRTSKSRNLREYMRQKSWGK